MTAVTLAAAALAVQGLSRHHRADELLASAIYFGYASTPLLDSLAASVAALPRDRRDPQAHDIGYVLMFIHNRGLTELFIQTYSRYRHPSRGKEAVDAVTRAVKTYPGLVAPVRAYGLEALGGPRLDEPLEPYLT